MTKLPKGRADSFRKPARHLGAFPPTPKNSAEAWRPKLNDRVQTPNGAGIVVKISNDMYLVDLENQPSQIWERLISIKPTK